MIVFADDDDGQVLEVEVDDSLVDTLVTQTDTAPHQSPHIPTQYTQHSQQATHNTTLTHTQNTDQLQQSQVTQPTQPRATTSTRMQPDLDTSRTTTQRPLKRKTAATNDVDRAIMDEIERGRRKEDDRDYAFCLYLHSEMKQMSEASKKSLKRVIFNALEEMDS